MINNVSKVLKRWAEPITGTRITGAFVNGRWTENEPILLSFNGVVQNALPDDLLVLEEGQRTEEAIKIHTVFKLIPQIDDTTNGDSINYCGKVWLVYNVAHRTIGNYHKAIAIRK